ncbi:carotenoid biosynthesis protein [Planococcus massiliensis]|uniref:carotenoid biosynthesis protein n=1 Tax=Planococcus massiliensis TaxID=1499687 RepID=UPI0006964894|nr:carotenoid biosynthesis protein [Planococcus massiliensis]
MSLALEDWIFRLFLFWYSIGIILLGFDILPAWLEWANAFFLILSGTLGFLYFLKRFGSITGSVLGAVIFIFTFVVEGMGAGVGFLFGSYDYTEKFAPNVFGVPIAIGFAWLMVMATTHVLARWIYPSGGVFYAIIGGIGAVIMDLIIDPVAYLIKGYWIWEDTGFYYDIPWTNFFGWFVVAFLLHMLIDWLMKRKSLAVYSEVPEKRMALLYVLMIAMFVMLALLGKFWLAAGLTTVLTVIFSVTAWRRRIS